MPQRFLLACASLLPLACTGPATIVHNPDAHRVFVDGVEVPAARADAALPGQVLPFRYYGTARWHAAPADVDGLPDYSRLPAGAPIPMPPPASLWLFPLDFPLELTRRLLLGREDHDVSIVLPATPAERVVPAEMAPSGLGPLVERAAAARSER